jgi:hypothetical protein
VLTQNVNDLKDERQELLNKILRGEDVGPIDDAEIPVILKEMFKPYEALSSSLTQMKLYMENVGIRKKTVESFRRLIYITGLSP